MALAILGHAEPEPPAALIRLLAQQFDIELRRLGILAQLLGQPGPGGVIIHVAGQLRLIAGQPAERLLAISLADGYSGQQQAKIGLLRRQTEPLFQHLAGLGQAAFAVEQARQLLARPLIVGIVGQHLVIVVLRLPHLALGHGGGRLALGQGRQLGLGEIHGFDLQHPRLAGRGGGDRLLLGSQFGLQIRLQFFIARDDLIGRHLLVLGLNLRRQRFIVSGGQIIHGLGLPRLGRWCGRGDRGFRRGRQAQGRRQRHDGMSLGS
ncbi:hypothetical protein D3C79_746470 [compost metagenome]